MFFQEIRRTRYAFLMNFYASVAADVALVAIGSGGDSADAGVSDTACVPLRPLRPSCMCW